ncbi:hypothetical protein BKH41_04290 [Helicobacter sp. 12S02232-10]|uniref:class I adenylate-forming enzyme family protein n=1 Tax=Helicobacter sp. 12S02232-10 TaxID=1476197 RepID=UPI000BA5E3A3|nr:class I adenylate-forming enzyme family protein [Helicobacter sp. 12S02232-10]PAF48854.1 hypothetical protein BKH41_04290 [Helicobacter sp. 12S02232-10]
MFLRHTFFERFQTYKNRIALIHKDQKYTYGDLNEKISELLLSLKIPDQSAVSLVGDYSFETIATFLALCIKKCIITPINLKPPTHLIEHLWAQFLIEKNQVLPIKKNLTCPQNHPLIKQLIQKNASGLIILSSASTGKPKSILHNLDLMLDFYAQKTFNPTNVAGVFLFDHIAGIDVLLSQFSTSGILCVPEFRTPQSVGEIIQKYRVEILPSSPTFLRLLLLAQITDTFDLTSLKLIIYGSEMMPPQLLKDLKNTLQWVKFKQSFGTSETNAIKTKNAKTASGFIRLDPAHTQYKIINNELWLKSKTQTLGYLETYEDTFEEGWFKTGDLVETISEDGEEFIKIIGRTKEIINVGGQKVLPQEVENTIGELKGIKDCLAYGEANPITGQSVSLKVVLDEKILDPKDKIGLKKLIREFCKNRLENYKIPTKIIVTQNLNVSTRFKKMRR